MYVKVLSPRSARLAAKIVKVRALHVGATTPGEKDAACRRLAELSLHLVNSVIDDAEVGE